MNNILASVSVPPNQKQPNRNVTDPAKVTPIVKKLNQKPNFNQQSKINQPINVQINPNPPVAVQFYNNPPILPAISRKNIPPAVQKINLNQQHPIPFPQTQQAQYGQPISKIAQTQQVQQIQKPDNAFYQKPQIAQIQQPIKKLDPPTPDKEIFSGLLSNYKRFYLLSIAKSISSKSENVSTKSRQSPRLYGNSKSAESNRNTNQYEFNQSTLKQDKKSAKSFIEPKDEKIVYDQTFIENFFFDKYHEESKINRLSRRQVLPPFNPHYETWEKVGYGYLVNPNPPYYYDEPHFVDFICQCKLKALAIGGEGSSVYAAKDEQAPLLASNARLQLSMLIDEHGIDHLKVEAKLRNASCRNPKPGTIDKLAKLCNSLETKIREYNDDIRNKYRLPPIVPYDLNDLIIEQNKEREAKKSRSRKLNYYIIPDHCKFPLEQIHFMTYALRMIELTSILTPKHCLHITKAFTLVFPLIMKAIVRPEKEWHFIGKKVHLTYFYRLFHLLNRLSEYFCTIPMIPCHASFGIINSLRSDITATWQKELRKISDNIEYGGCLSWLLCEMRDISLALTIHLNDVRMIEEVIKLYDNYESHHPERFPHSNNYNRNYFGKSDQQNSTAKEGYYRNRNVKHVTKRGGYNGNTGAGKRLNYRKMSGARFIYNNDNMKDESAFNKKIEYKENDKFDFTVNDLMKIASRENNDQRIYMLKFVVDKDGLLSFIVKQPDDVEIKKAASYYNVLTQVPPFYPFILLQQKPKQKKPDESEVPIYINPNDAFRFDAAYPSLEKFGRPLKIHFEPYSQQSFFSLNASHFY